LLPKPRLFSKKGTFVVSNAPKILKDILGQDLAGYRLEHAVGLSSSREMPALTFVSVVGTSEMLVFTDRDLADEVAKHVTPEPSERPFVEVLIHSESRSAYWINHHEPFAARPMQLVTREDFDKLLAVNPKPFTWSSGG
jgi:hypothetical protein